MTVGLIASVISAVIAVFIGIAAAMGSQKVDSLVNWIIDLVMGVPHMVLIMLISVAFGRGIKGLLIGVAATHWCSLARLIRAEVMQLRMQQYVAVSRKLGKSSGWILVNHLLPHPIDIKYLKICDFSCICAFFALSLQIICKIIYIG